MIFDAQGLKAQGVEGGWAIGIHDIVRFRDLDSYGHVNNVVFHSWFEDVRVMFFEAIGFEITKRQPAMFVVRAADISFDRQLHFKAKYWVLTKPTKIGNSSLQLDYVVRNDGADVVSGTTALVLSDLQKGQSVPIPDQLRDEISAYL